MAAATDRRVLVTGATGFIGRALVPALCARLCALGRGRGALDAGYT
jgi:nucleoside-diphosphate-sugar epimerase